MRSGLCTGRLPAMRAGSGGARVELGGRALLADGVISRPALDVDMFAGQEHGVQAAACAVQAFDSGRQDQVAGRPSIFPGAGEGLAEWIVTVPGGSRVC